MATAESVLIVRESFIGEVDGVTRTFLVGENIRPDDKAVKKWPEKFRNATFAHDAQPVEQATKAPGEKR